MSLSASFCLWVPAWLIGFQETRLRRLRPLLIVISTCLVPVPMRQAKVVALCGQISNMFMRAMASKGIDSSRNMSLLPVSPLGTSRCTIVSPRLTLAVLVLHAPRVAAQGEPAVQAFWRDRARELRNCPKGAEFVVNFR